MRILANENFPGEAVDALRREGHDVVWIRTEAPGSSDKEVLQRAQSEMRILVTFDKDFGELAFHLGLPASNGIILFRIQASTPGYVAPIAVTALATRQDWIGHFSVIEEERIRMTPHPDTSIQS